MNSLMLAKRDRYLVFRTRAAFSANWIMVRGPPNVPTIQEEVLCTYMAGDQQFVTMADRKFFANGNRQLNCAMLVAELKNWHWGLKLRIAT